MKKLIEGAMQRSTLVLICIVMIIAWGGLSAFRMQRDYLPSINNTTLLVAVRASNAQADQIKQTVTPKIQDAIRPVNGLTDVETNAYDGGLLVSLYFPMDYDMDKAEADVKQALLPVSLPSDIKAPTVTRVTSSSFPILSYSLTPSGDRVSETELRSKVETDFEKQLKSIPGVADVRVVGAASDGYVLTLRLHDLLAHKLTVDDWNQSVAAAIPMSEGMIASSQGTIPIAVGGNDLNEEQIQQIPIKNKQGVSVPLGEVADLRRSMTDMKTVSRTNGAPSVLLDVLKTPSANITTVAERVKDRIRQISYVQKGDVSLTVLLDREHELNAALAGLVREGLLGCIFSMLCVLLFYRNVRSTLLIAVSLPTSLFATTALLEAMGYTMNILTVSGLIVAMGRIVDDSIVILDNMYRKYQEKKENGSESILHALGSAVREMVPAIFASTATTIAVYAPIALVGGIIGASYAGFAWSVVIALVVSFFVAMLVVPAFAYMGWHRRPPAGDTVTLEPLMKPVLKFALQWRGAIVAASIALFLAAGLFAAKLPISLLPTAKTGEVAVQIELPKGSSLSAVDQEVVKVEELLKQNPQVSDYSATFGSAMTPVADDVFDEGGGYIQPPNVANLSISLTDKGELDAFVAGLKPRLSALSRDVVYTVSNQNLSGDDSQMKILLTGADQRTLDAAAQTVRKQLAAVDGLSVQGAVDLTNGTRKYAIVLDQDKIKQLGVNRDDVMKVISAYTASAKDFNVPANGLSIPVDVNVQQASGDQAKPEQVLNAMLAETVTGDGGQAVPISQVASLSDNPAPTSIQERNGQPFATVLAQITSKDIGKVSHAVNKELKRTELPSGVSYSTGGISTQVARMILDMSLAIGFSLLLVLFITTTVFKGWRAPFAVLLSVPLALSGIVGALMLVGGEWDLAALIGALMLVGIVVTNGIVLVDRIERNRRAGMPMQAAIAEGTLSRVRPIVMTAATTILTLLPLALSSSADTVISSTLGVVVIGGLVTSTLNSLLVIPIFYGWLHRAQEGKSSTPSAYAHIR
ncbi:MAG: efflux RND transporter permease subunit [Cohnella sp.]|nr:efflux RND transporter permease subunit [Cohnella sp.]